MKGKNDDKEIERCVYKVWSPSTDRVYIGQTQSIISRQGEIEACYRKYLNGKGKKMRIFEIIELGDYEYEIVEKKICDRVNIELLESHYIEEYGDRVVNKNKVDFNAKRIKQNESSKKSYANHREARLEYARQVYNLKKTSMMSELEMLTTQLANNEELQKAILYLVNGRHYKKIYQAYAEALI